MCWWGNGAEFPCKAPLQLFPCGVYIVVFWEIYTEFPKLNGHYLPQHAWHCSDFRLHTFLRLVLALFFNRHFRLSKLLIPQVSEHCTEQSRRQNCACRGESITVDKHGDRTAHVGEGMPSPIPHPPHPELFMFQICIIILRARYWLPSSKWTSS